MVRPGIFGLSSETRSLTQPRCGLLLETLAFLRGRPNKGARTPNFSRLLRTTEHHLLFQKRRRKNSKSVPFIATFCFNGSKTTFSTFFFFFSVAFLMAASEASEYARSSRSRRLRSLVGIRSDFTLQFVQ